MSPNGPAWTGWRGATATASPSATTTTTADPDLFVTRWRSYALLRNRGDGTFEDVTGAAGLGGDRDWPTSAALADLDGDGDLDLYVCHYLVFDVKNPRICTDASIPGEPLLQPAGSSPRCRTTSSATTAAGSWT